MADRMALNSQGQAITTQDGKPVYVDDQGRQYAMVNGAKVYTTPLGFNASGAPTYDPGTLASFNDSGGWLHTPSLWNSQTGVYDPGHLDMGKLIPLAGLAAIGGGIGASALGGGAATAGLGPSTAANMAATQAGLSGGGLSATGAGAAAGATGGGMNYVTGLALDKGIGAATNLFGAKMGANAQDNAIGAQTAASKYAADLQAKSAQEALDFAKQQAALSAAQANAANYGNYTQYQARQQTVGALADMLGIGDARKIAPYVPLPTSAGQSSGMPGAASSGPLPFIDNTGDIGKQVSAYFKSRGVSDAETPYWVGKWQELVDRGKELNDPQYAVKRLAAADVFGGQPMQTATAKPLPYMTTLGTMMPSSPMVVTPPLSRGF